MKFVIILGDGMGDYPIASLGNLTPLEYAHTPNMDRIAGLGTLGLVDTIPSGMSPASDVANLSILGYDPRDCYSGRGPLEAANRGIELATDDLAFRCNLVTLGGSNELSMLDYSAGQISSEESRLIIEGLDDHLNSKDIKLYPGVSFRNILVWKNGCDKIHTTPPHDITGKAVAPYWPQGEGASVLIDLIEIARDYLAGHPINDARRLQGKKPANSIWPWGQGRKPRMAPMRELYGISGAMISAVDLLNGIGKYAGLEAIAVPGTTDYIDTDYAAQAEYAIAALRDFDFVFLHVEAPDAMGHEGNLPGKIKAIEDFDRLVVGALLAEMNSFSPCRVMVATDHPTPIALMTHTADASPFAVLSSIEKENLGSGLNFSERNANNTRIKFSPGYHLFRSFINQGIV